MCRYVNCHYARWSHEFILNITQLNVVMLTINKAQCFYAAECHYIECRSAECLGAISEWLTKIFDKENKF